MRNSRITYRRRRHATAEHILDLVALVPWWGSLLFAILSYIVTHQLRASLGDTASKPGASVQFPVTFTAAAVAQYALPAFFVVCSALSALRRTKLKKVGLSGAPLRNKPRKAPREQQDLSTRQAVVCPECNAPMVRRTAKRTDASGSYFWGCTGFPDCRGTRPYP